jgi:predicted transcriptional regulator
MLSDTMAEATVEEISGYISGNVKRKQIVDVLHKNGSKTSEDLRKITRTPKVIMEKVLQNMVENGVITKQGDTYTLTENGKIAANALPKQSAKATIQKFDSNIRREI